MSFSIPILSLIDHTFTITVIFLSFTFSRIVVFDRISIFSFISFYSIFKFNHLLSFKSLQYIHFFSILPFTYLVYFTIYKEITNSIILILFILLTN